MNLRICIGILMGIVLILLSGCKKSPIGTTTVKDVQGNEYGTMIIGDQTWMTDNLRTISFRDGSWMLTGLYEGYEWASAAAACCFYPEYEIDGLDTEAEVIDAYGLLYNWNAVHDSRGLCPTGWHVPTDEDWEKLVTFLGGADIAGGKLKSKRTDPDSHPRWESPNTDATDNFGFAALPAGLRSAIGEYLDVGYTTTFWSSTPFESNFVMVRKIYNDDTSLERYYKDKKSGFSVRCIAD